MFDGLDGFGRSAEGPRDITPIPIVLINVGF